MASPKLLPPPSPLQRLSTFKDNKTLAPPSPSPPLHQPSSATSTSSSPLDSFSADPTFSAFLSPSFDSAAFSSRALASGSAAAVAETLQDGIRRLDHALRAEVTLRHPDLLRHLSSLSSASSALSSLRSSVSSLQSSVRRARSGVSDPRSAVRSASLRLSNLRSAADLLHASSKLLRLCKKLRDLSDKGRPDDLATMASIHREIVLIHGDHDLEGINAVDAEMAWVAETGERIRAEAMKAVDRGLDPDALDQSHLSRGLQVFYNLGELGPTVDLLVSRFRSLGVKSVGYALDLKAVSSGGGGGPGGGHRSGTPQIGGGGRANEGLWSRLGNCMDQICSAMKAMWHLQRLLSKQRDATTHVLFLDEVWQEGDPLLTERVWEAIVKSFASQMKSAFTASSFVKEVFTLGYPKLFSKIENLLERISRETDVKGVLPALTSEGKEQMVAAIDPFQTAFLTLCLSRLSDLVNNVFPMSGRSVPSKDQISRIVFRIEEEIEAVKPHGHLTLLVLHEIGKALFLLAERAECQISTGPEAKQVTGTATPQQLKNFSLCHHLQEIHTRLISMTSTLPSIASEVLSPSLGTIYGVACDSIASLFQEMLNRLETCILQIHEQDFGLNSSIDANNTSTYMDELQRCAVHFRTEFLSKLLPSAAHKEIICTQLVRRMASRVLTLFIRHAALVRPLSEAGKLRLARDMAELELAVGQNLFPVEQLGGPYRALRAFRPIIFLETAQLDGSPLLKELPPSVVLHHLYSRGPEELQSPWQKNQVTLLSYSLWLDKQGEEQIWRGIKVTLDDYAVKVRARGEELSPVYYVMLKIGSVFVENTSASQISQ
ncbi:hypothetical protein QJS04_geneDACA018079 [Acorus gramineus]|uniref:Conserved oligomeric Golgi complex subunit 5 n=1 Tax=Acorus gramineus TaxID=55184 RepID=A0AAV9A9Z9_ACOGR|nr:hypothetical protein QJS04_geneDACA018079 [Acorus gramineus]